ncbi:hypothetical protein BV898_19627 [Hypsibius exemplaris]|uniref:Uncharacterized protein n=1 Tax=Hypsibius exemplaris TaxID=2072580 RepID=A0A9X6NSI5_HYPEX|nr:hypothetical protein BV898_19627 [Hypsibius exemplaris]
MPSTVKLFLLIGLLASVSASNVPLVRMRLNEALAQANDLTVELNRIAAVLDDPSSECLLESCDNIRPPIPGPGDELNGRTDRPGNTATSTPRMALTRTTVSSTASVFFSFPIVLLVFAGRLLGPF